MNVKKMIKDLDWLRESIIGRNMPIETCYGKKPLVYADYTASGRCVYFIENYLTDLKRYYANTHTEDDFTGRTMTALLHEAEREIKRMVNAGESGKIIFTGTGATGGVMKLQQIIGVYWPPATKIRINDCLHEPIYRQDESKIKCHADFLKKIDLKKPVVFVGPYEHHSNEIMWRETFCEVIEIPLNEKGFIDLEELERNLSDPRFAGREKIGSFSAASNVSGVRTDVYEIARKLHKHGALACFDFAACAPYIEINMNLDDKAYFDAIFLAPHKFLGGPGSSGILVFNERIYKKELPPTVAAGGTVDFVTRDREKYIDDIETREKPGTPGIIQDIKVALVFQLKEKVGIAKIEKIEHYYLKRFYDHFSDNEKIQFYGPTDPEVKINIVPFNIIHKDRIFHPKFITTLLNDLFGIQTRAGCSCAGPYGHRLLNISEEISRYYQCVIGIDKYSGVKPGWVRLNLHYTLSEEEFNYLVAAIDFVIENAEKFLLDYVFDFSTGDWYHRKENCNKKLLELNIDNVLNTADFKQADCGNCQEIYRENLSAASNLADGLQISDNYPVFNSSLEELMFFYVKNYVNLKGFESDKN
jgi:selenocysteine lyase/cysteine desulfurase